MSELRFELAGGGVALFTSRAQGNLSSIRGDGAEEAEDARRRLCDAIGVRRLHRGYQVHGTVVRRVLEGSAATDQPHEGSDDADGQATCARGRGMMVLTADCLPVALASEGAVAMVHAGWRGLAAGALQEGVRAVAELGGGARVVALIGPCAGPCCYEVGEEVHAQFGGAHRRGRHIDLRAIARDRLLAGGVGEVRDVEACTICDERFFSHRREGARAGRQAGVAWLS